MLTAQENKPVFSGFIRNYTGILTKDMDQFSILQNTFNLNVEYRGQKTGFKVNPYVYQYFDKNIDFGLF